MFDSFHCFTNLPVELQIEIWSSAVRPAKAGVQIFSLSSDHRSQPHEDGAPEAPWVGSYYLTAPRWAFGPKSSRVNGFDEITASWTKNNPSTYLLDSGVWNACRQSNRVMRDVLGPTKPIAIRTKVRCGRSDVEVDAPESDSSQQRSIIVSPSQDLFILQPDGPDMFSRFLFEDLIQASKSIESIDCIPIYADPARQLKNLPPIVPFKETQGKSWLVNPSLTPRTKALSHGHDMASQAAPEWCHHPPATAEISLRFGRR
ncbi:hypothetical protein FOMA001_g20130 [Fusarium oxysporum f. sp. matthiolae]|nr:hypothetical protein FOMA001_g20130 [Fusarium oxysporum f. sp. matthiolae]